MSANRLFQLLEDQGLLDADVLQELRRSLSESKSRVTAESLAKLLVENGQLTRFQATRLVSQLAGHDDESASSNSSVATPSADGVDDLIPPSEVEEVVDAVLIEEEEDGRVGKVSDAPVNIDNPIEFAREVPSAEPITNDDLPEPNAGFVKPVKIGNSKDNQWDAFRIWGVGFFLSVLVVLFGWLVYWLMSGSASEFYKQAVASYESRDYEIAAQQFAQYAKSYPKADNVSLAKVMVVIAHIRQCNEQLGDPAQAITAAETELPTVVNEAGLSNAGVRSDLASALVAVAQKMIERADSAKTTNDRKEKLDLLDKHIVTMTNPLYIPNEQRTTNEGRFKAIEEDRARIRRDIQRAEDLVQAVEKMNAAIAQADVDGAYQARREVTRRYPQLETDKQLIELQIKATDLQRQAVKASDKALSPVTPEANRETGTGVLLYKRTVNSKSNSEITLDPSTTVFVKAKGSVYGLRGMDGTVLWRKYVGFENVSEPIRLSNDPQSDCLIVIPNRNVLARLSGQDGATLWEVDFGDKIFQPAVDGQVVFVATADGRVTSIDTESGQSKWSRQIPQKLQVGVGGSVNKPGRYVVGEHSNIYVLSSGDGACKEVFFLGHSAGTVAVPPIHSLGLLFVFENFEVGSSRIHIFKTNDQGTEIERCQALFSMKGHVVVPPSLDGRRMVVMTDLGETHSFDLEPANEKNKLNRVAGLVANETKPRISWPLVVGNELWIASNRFARYQIQVSGQKLVRDWVLEDEDQFTARPTKMESVVFHSRIVRGTEGVRYAATQAQSGKSIWETDLGIPIVGVQPSVSGLAVVNSQGALFEVGAAELSAGKPVVAEENPGRNQRTMQFEAATPLDAGRVAWFNPGHGTQIAVFDPQGKSGNRLQINSLQISDGKPTGEGVAIRNGVVVPLDNGQLAFIDPVSGRQAAQPFQPTIQAGKNVTWVTPVLLDDKETIVGATNQRMIYRLKVDNQVKELSQTKTDRVLTQRLAVSSDGSIICGIGRGEAQDSAELHQASDLARIAGVDLDGRITWGPFSVDAYFLAFSETGGLMAIDKKGAIAWKTAIGRIAPVGKPLIDGTDILLASSTGMLFRIEIGTGAVQSKFNVDEPLSGSPLKLGSALLLAGAEGALIAVPAAKTLGGQSGEVP
jgi:outer membrane protein assembly factor BamB/TolA-binding protein